MVIYNVDQSKNTFEIDCYATTNSTLYLFMEEN